jgi:hypothetical protein
MNGRGSVVVGEGFLSERIRRGEEDESYYICTYKDSIVKPTKQFEREKEGGENGNIMEEVNLFKVTLCTCLELLQ